MYKLAPNMEIKRMPAGAENPFTVISNDETSFAMDRRLTSSAKGILFTVFTLCEKKWHFSVEGLCGLMKDGETKIRSTLEELEKLGYYVTEQVKDEKGRYKPTKYYFYESVKLNDRKDAAKQNGLFSSLCPDLGFPDADAPYPENPAQLNTNILNTKGLNTKSVSLSED